MRRALPLLIATVLMISSCPGCGEPTSTTPKTAQPGEPAAPVVKSKPAAGKNAARGFKLN